MARKKAGTSRSAKTETAIVHVPGFVEDGNPGASDQRIFLTPFAELLYILKNRQRDEVTSNLGTATWVEFPLEEVFADGLWAVIIALSKKYGLVIKTEHQIVNKIAPQVEYRINLGLTCNFANMQEAADSFEQEVIAEVLKNFRKASTHETHLPQSIWQLPAARFFARMTKTAQETAEKISKEATRLHFLNAYAGYELTEESSKLSYLESVKQFLQWEVESHGHRTYKTSTTTALTEIAGGLCFLELTMKQINIFRKMPYRLETLPAEVSLPQIPLSLCWVETQLMLAAIDAPDREYLTETEHEKALGIIVGGCHDEAIIKRFFERIEARGVTFEDEQVAYLMNYLPQRLSGLNNSAGKERYPGVGRDNPFMFQFVRPDDHLRLKDLEREIIGPESAKKRKEIAGNLLTIDWERITQDDFAFLVESPEIPTTELARGIMKMKKPARKPLLEILLEERKLDEKSFAILQRGGPIALTDENAEKYWLVAGKAWLRKYLDSNEELDPLRVRDLIIKILNRFESAELAEIVSQPSYRLRWTIFFSDYFTTFRYSQLRGGNDPLFAKMWNKLENELQKRLIFGAIIWDRTHHFYSGASSDWEVAVPPWCDLTESKDNNEKLLLLRLGLTTTQLQKLVRSHKYSEEESLLWLCASESDREEQLAAYKRNRAKYFRNHPVKRVSRDKGLAKKDSKRTVKKNTVRKK